MGKTSTKRIVASNGYVLVRVGKDHHLADVRGYAYEHRLVAEKKLGRRLARGEQVHHVDEDKQNNVDENLEVVPSFAHHRALHRKTETGQRNPGCPNPEIMCECDCGSTFPRYDTSGRPRRFISGHNPKLRDSKTGAFRRG